MENQLYLYFIEFCVSVSIMLSYLLLIILIKSYINKSKGLTNSMLLCILALVGMLVVMPTPETVMNMLGYFNN